VIPELPEINLGFASCYPKFPNKIRVSGISGSGIPGSGFGLRVFCPVLLACQLGGTDDDNLIIHNLPLFLSDAARTWLEHLPPA
jgi:hypothetical protein